MRFGVLGPLEVRHGGDPIDVGGRQPRIVLAALLVAGGRSLTVDTLVDAIWGDAPPRSAAGTVQSYISRLRRLLALEPEGARLTFDEAGYRLEVDAALVDFHRFEQLANDGRARLDGGRPAEAAALLTEALGLWRGPAFGELAGHDPFVAMATRLEEQRLVALEDRMDADLRLGRDASLVGELTELVTAHPLRESPRAKLAVALYRAGRQADALGAVADAKQLLRDELGIDPGRELRELEAAILNHDPSLDLATAPRESSAARQNDMSTAESGAPTGIPLVGRDAELSTLVAALEEAASDARVVVVEGEPGIGKTRLVEELRSIATARRYLAVWGRADESGAAPALWPWLQILRELHGRDAGTPGLGDLVAGDTPLLAGQGTAVQFERFEAIAERLAAAGATTPVAVLLDDVQWADATSLALLTFLTSRVRAGVLVIVVLRVLEIGRADAVTDALAAIARRAGSRRLLLRGLSAPDTTEMLRAAGLPDQATTAPEEIHTRAEGNPFYAIELARLLTEEGGLTAEVPATVRDVVRRRLAQLPDPTVDLLAVAGVAGRDVDLPVLARAAGRELHDCIEHLEPAVVHRLLVDVPEHPGGAPVQPRVGAGGATRRAHGAPARPTPSRRG